MRKPTTLAGALPERAELARLRIVLLDHRTRRCRTLPPEVRYDIDVARAEIQMWAAALPSGADAGTDGWDPDLVAWGRRVADGLAEAAIPLIDEALDEAFAMLRPFETRTPQA